MSEHPVTHLYEKTLEQDVKAVLNETHSEEQIDDYCCGPAVITDILKTLHLDADQKDLIDEANIYINELAPGLTMVDLGTPPEIMTKLLQTHGVDFRVKESAPVFDDRAARHAENYLDNALDAGYNIICPIQSMPDYKKERNMHEDGHYVIVCGKVDIRGVKHYITIDPMFHYYQRLANEGSMYSMHRSDVLPREVEEFEPEVFTTRDYIYTSEVQDKLGIDPEKFAIDPTKYGYRFMNKNLFLENWQDISGLGEKFNFYGIAVKMPSADN